MGDMVKLSAEELAELRQQIKNAGMRSEAAATASLEQKGATVDNKAGGAFSKRVVVNIAKDKMSATVLLTDPGDDEVYTVPEIVTELRKSKVITGIKSSIIMKMLEDEQYNEHVVVAMGMPMEPSKEGYYDYKFKTTYSKTPEIRPDGTTDYASVGRLESVESGQVIAVYHPAKPGRNGYNVLGMEIVAKLARDLPVLRGQHIERNVETGEYKAKMSGKISLRDYNIEILDVHEIRDNVTLVQGKIEFYGDLIIHGDVENGVVIRSGRNVVIKGTVGAATIFAGGDIILSKGIQGGGRGKVSARGNVFADFIEYAKVDAGMDIYANSIINSEISTNGNVVVSGKHGSIIGGSTHGLCGVTANAAGSANEVRTVIHAGFPEENYRKFSLLSNQEKMKNNELSDVIEDITVILRARARNGYFSQEQKLSISKLKERKEKICAEIENIKKDMESIGASMNRAAGAGIVIRGTVFRNVMLGIDAASLCITREESYVKYICKNHVIERRTIPVGMI